MNKQHPVCGTERQALPTLLECQEVAADKVHLCFPNHASFSAPKIFQNRTTIWGPSIQNTSLRGTFQIQDSSPAPKGSWCLTIRNTFGLTPRVIEAAVWFKSLKSKPLLRLKAIS